MDYLTTEQVRALDVPALKAYGKRVERAMAEANSAHSEYQAEVHRRVAHRPAVDPGGISHGAVVAPGMCAAKQRCPFLASWRSL